MGFAIVTTALPRASLHADIFIEVSAELLCSDKRRIEGFPIRGDDRASAYKAARMQDTV